MQEVVKLIDSYTGEVTSYYPITELEGGGAVTDADVDGVIIRKRGDTYYKRAFTGPVNIKWFGAKGNGVTDDSSAFETALKITSTLNNQLKIEDGTYKIKNVNLRSNTSIFGSGTANIVADTEDSFRGNSINNVTISGINFSSVNQSTGFRNVYLVDSSYIKVESCTFTGGQMGIRGEDCEYIWFDKNRITDMVQWGIRLTGGQNITITNNISSNNGLDGLKIAGSQNVAANDPRTVKNVIVSGNISNFNASDGFDIASNNIENIIITNNIFIGNSFHGIDCKILEEYVGSVKRLVVKNNLISGNLLEGINLQSSNQDSHDNYTCMVADNYLDGEGTTNTYGIKLATGSNCRLVNNTILNYDYGIRVSNTASSKIYNNTIDVSKVGVWVLNGSADDSVSSLQIFDNNITSTTLPAISIGNYSSGEVIGSITTTVIRNNRAIAAGSTALGIYYAAGTVSQYYGNIIKLYTGAASTPSWPCNKNDLVEAIDPVSKGHSYWIATQDNTSGQTNFASTGVIDTEYALLRQGTTAQRPTVTTSGYQYFDTTLGKPIYWNGTTWVDSTGTTV